MIDKTALDKHITREEDFFCEDCEGEVECDEECRCDSCIEAAAGAHEDAVNDTYD